MKGKKKILTVTLIAGLLLTSTGAALAEEEDPLAFQLDEVVVSATKTLKTVKDVPSTVVVITKEDMEKRHIKKLDDALKAIPGVYVKQTKGMMGSTDSINMRGFDGQGYVKILVDGQSQNDGYNSGVSMANMPIDTVERIEVIKGSGSALFGSSAMGGVINIITKSKPEDQTVLRVGFGNLGTKEAMVYSSGSAGKLDYFINAGRTEVDGYVNDESYLTAKKGSDKAKGLGDNGMDRENYGLKLIYHFTDHSRLNISADRNDFAYFYDNQPTRGGNKEKSFNVGYEDQMDERSFIRLRYGQKEVDSFYVTTNFDSKSDNVANYTHNLTLSTVAQTELQYNYRLGEKDLLTIGYVYETQEADGRKQIIKPNSIKDGKADENIGGKTVNQAIYVQDEHKFGDKLTAYLGARYDDWRFDDGYFYSYDKKTGGYKQSDGTDLQATSFSPKVGFVYQANDRLTLRTSVGKAFKAPTIYQMVKTWESDTTIYRPSASLKPEESMQYELGLDYRFNETMLGRLSFFYSDVDNLITDKIISKNAPGNTTGKEIREKINSGKNEIKGFEIGLDKQWSRQWSSFVNYTYTSSKTKENERIPAMIGQQIKGVPKDMFNLGINYTQGRWNGSLTGLYTSNTDGDEKRGSGYAHNESFFVVDCKVAYALSEDASLAVSVDNLFDRDYYTYYKAAPRTVYMEFTKKF